MLRDSGDAASMLLADKAVAAFQKAAGSAKTAVKDAVNDMPHAPAEHTIDINAGYSALVPTKT